nr:MAG TPA: hypothetical protein [Caudoviricetes sp.]
MHFCFCIAVASLEPHRVVRLPFYPYNCPF